MVTRKIYMPDKKCLAFFKESADSKFWDSHWNTEEINEKAIRLKTNRIFLPVVRKYLKSGMSVLEGGCGVGNIVNALVYNGFMATGIDFASKTVRMVNNIAPDLDIRIGDVRMLDFPDNTFDCYISGGVIEHFWEGYSDIIKEMARVVKNGGFLITTFPSMSTIRKRKAKAGLYATINFSDLSNERKNFYQFALNHQEVISDLENVGFKLIEIKKSMG